jgi:competence CoiA-like predicted nuclease
MSREDNIPEFELDNGINISEEIYQKRKIKMAFVLGDVDIIKQLDWQNSTEEKIIASMTNFIYEKQQPFIDVDLDISRPTLKDWFMGKFLNKKRLYRVMIKYSDLLLNPPPTGQETIRIYEPHIEKEDPKKGWFEIK